MDVFRALLIISSLFILAACAPKQTAIIPPSTSQTEVKSALTAPKTGWQAEWDKTLAAARKEGKPIPRAKYRPTIWQTAA